MKATTIFLVQLPSSTIELVRRAGEKAFTQVRFVPVNSVSDAAQLAVAERNPLLIMNDRDEAAIVQAAQATDEHDFPRWAAVVLGRSRSDLVESILPEECNPALLARVFRSVLQQHELLLENLRLLGDLKSVARRFTHDLLTPLNCLHITCEVMNELLDKNDTAAVRDQIGLMQNSISETCVLIDRVSQVFRASTEPTPLLPVAVGATVQKALGRLSDEIHQAGMTIEQPDDWPEIIGVEPWMEIIWWNLIRNAFLHGAPSAPIQLGWSCSAAAVRFWVTNGGNSIPPELQPRLFQRLENLHKIPSAGFGLPLVQRLVALQGGRCGYERPDRGGSRFYFTLPAFEPCPVNPK